MNLRRLMRGSARRAARLRRGVRRSTLGPAGSTSPHSRPRNAGTTGSSSNRRTGRSGSKNGTCLYPRPASTANQPAACWPMSTATRLASVSSRATLSIQVRADATARRDRRRSIRLLTPTASSIHSSAQASVGAADGSRCPGTRPWITSRAGCGTAILEKRHNEVMYHVGRSGEDGFTERVLAAWGVDGHNTHTNVCSAGGRSGYDLLAWGSTGPVPDHANARLILLHQRPSRGRALLQPPCSTCHGSQSRRRETDRLDTRLSNTATHADHWLPSYPGSEPAVLLAIANHLIQTGAYNREFLERWWNWKEYLSRERPESPVTFANFEQSSQELYARLTRSSLLRASPDVHRDRRAGRAAGRRAGHALLTHIWRWAAAGNLGGWQIARACLLNV